MNRTLIFILGLLFIFCAACGDETNPPSDEIIDDMGQDTTVDLVTTNDVTTDTEDLIDNDNASLSDRAPTDVLCQPCISSTECGGGGQNLCLTLPSGESVCSTDCTLDPEGCPTGYFCSLVDNGGAMQCIPETLYCESQCLDNPPDCPDGEVCDPLTGECRDEGGLCDECVINEHCGEGNLCLTFPDIDNFRGCGQACSTSAPCPEDYFCAAVDETGLNQQCVPTNLTCVERCEDVICAEDEICNPLTGNCDPPLEYCEECTISALCGGPQDLCLGLMDGEAYCTTDCSAGQVCPIGSFCAGLAGGGAQCIPSNLTCVDHCLEPTEVICPEGQNCDPLDGSCHLSLVDICGSPCNEHYECGEQYDLCISYSGTLGGEFCSRVCSATDPCPIGYLCLTLTDGVTQQCAPEDSTLVCDNCSDVVCPEEEACRPSTGDCLPLPLPCTDSSECPVGELCNTGIFENRCEPIGLPCLINDYGYSTDCNLSTQCSASSWPEEGVCLQRCYAEETGCPDWAPECDSFHRVYTVCVERGLGLAERCGKLMDFTQSVGQPCPYSSTDELCPSTAPTCIEDVIEGIPGFCTDECDMDDDTCPLGSSCGYLPGIDDPYCVPEECGCMAYPNLGDGETDLLQVALDGFSLTRCDLGSTALERELAGVSVANDPYRLEIAGMVRNDDLYGSQAVATHVEALGTELLLSEAIRQAGLDQLGSTGTTLAHDVGTPTLCESIQSLFDEMDPDLPSCGSFAALESELSFSSSAFVAGLITALAIVSDERDRALDVQFTAEEFDLLLTGLPGLLIQSNATTHDLDSVQEQLLAFPYKSYIDVSIWLTEWIEENLNSSDLTEGDLVDLSLDIDTPYGRIVLSGTGDNTYCNTEETCTGEGIVLGEEHILLLMDFGGNDLYLSPAATTHGYDEAASLLLDLGGDDYYGYSYLEEDIHADHLFPADADGRADGEYPVSLSESGRQGSAMGGISLLYDLGLGEDRYESLRMSQGFGLLGVGVIFDDGSETTDTFQSEALSQGAGMFGIGLLLSGDGSTTYEGYHMVQGFGGPMGIGYLIDESGDDNYLAYMNEDLPLYTIPSRLTPVITDNLHWSVSQGVGYGIPSETPEEGNNASGGLGMLMDKSGNDTFQIDTMGQGAGYWHGLGMLVETSGDDQYIATAWAQGAGLDFGAGVMAEQSGSDNFNCPPPLSPDGPAFCSTPKSVLGSGRNYGLGLYIDESGDDIYAASSQSLGAGFLNGHGLFIENKDNDTYAVSSEDSMGRAILSLLGSEPADNPRRDARTIGIFVDADGVDLYPDRDVSGFGDNGDWTQITEVGFGEESYYEWGVGSDGFGGTAVSTLP